MAGQVSTIVSRRTACAAFAIIPLTVAGGALILCGCSTAAWVIEIATATLYIVWIARGKR
jgi:hypothetical protein